MAYIKIKGKKVDPFHATCGGSLISDQDILTAAHCLKDVTSEEDIQVYLGLHEVPSSLFASKNLMSIPVSSFVIHSDYNKDSHYRMYNDIALIRLRSPINTTRSLSHICLSPLESDITTHADTLFVTGFGVKGQVGSLVDPLVLQEANTYPIKTESCRKQYPSMEISTEKQFCAGNSSSGWTCTGDSGGPVSIRKDGKIFQVGIISVGPQFCNKKGFTHSNVFEKISGHRDFIEKYAHGSVCFGGIEIKKRYYTPNRVTSGINYDRVQEHQMLKCVCGDTTKIKGNRKPWNVIIEATNYYSDAPLTCDGVIISDRHVIAPHECVNNKQLFVRRGTSETSSKMAVSSVHIPNNPRRFAVVELREPMQFDDDVSPVCLANFNTQPGHLLAAQGTQAFPQFVRQQGCNREASTVCTECVTERDFIVTEKETLEYLIGVDDWYQSNFYCSSSYDITKFTRISDFYSFLKETTRDAKWCPSKYHLIANNSRTVKNDYGPCQCGLPSTVSRIAYSGRPSEKGKYPWIVSLVNKNVNPARGCAGTIISDRHILTAARCLNHVTNFRNSLDKLEVTMNAYTDDDRQIMPKSEVMQVSIHPRYNARNFEYDIAIIKLMLPMMTDGGFSPICLPKGPSAENSYKFAGWGFSANRNNNGRYGSKNLNEITVIKYSDSYCRSVFGSLYNNQDICAGMCISSVGDGGSPLSEVNSRGRYIQVGISQATYPGCARGLRGPDSFESVNKNLNWIHDTISDGLMCNDADA
jgi:secreted trypsin-like serine protease